MEDENKDKIIDISTDLRTVVDTKTRLKRNLTPDKFMALVAAEVGSVRKCNRIIKKIEKYLCSDEFIFALEPKDLINLMNMLIKSKHASLSFIARLYDVSTKNEIIRAYFQENSISPTGNMKQDIRVREIVNEMKRRARESHDLPPES